MTSGIKIEPLTLSEDQDKLTSPGKLRGFFGEMNRSRQATGKVDSDIPMKYKEMVVAEKRSRQNSAVSM